MILENENFKLALNSALHKTDVSGSALINADCMDILPYIPDKSVQLILADLPYGTTACKWDSIIDLDLLWKEYKRIIKPYKPIILFGSQPFTTRLISSNYDWFKYCWVWEKNRATGHVHAKNRPMKIHEDICVFSEGNTLHINQSDKRMPYYPQGLNKFPDIVYKNKGWESWWDFLGKGISIDKKGWRFKR